MFLDLEFTHLKTMRPFLRNGDGLRFYFALLWLIGFASLSDSSAYELKDVEFVEVSCNYSGITAKIVTQSLFQGAIYAQANYFNPNCRFCSPGAGTKGVSFFLPLTDCGNFIREADGNIYVSNTIIVQKHRVVETDSDIMQNISCKLPRPDSADTEEFSHESHPTHYRNEEIESWMDFQLGGDILGVDIPNKLLVGDEFTVVVHLKDGGIYEDLQVEKCWAYDGETVSTSRYFLQIFDIHSCQKSDWMSGFNLTKGTKNVSDSMTYGIMKAFKFPLSKNLHFTCSVQACRSTCLNYCDIPESERSNAYPSRSKRSDPGSVPEKSLRERHRLMKATIKALGAKLMERNRGGLSENDSSFLKRASDIKNGTLVNNEEYEEVASTTDSQYSTDMFWNDMYYFNLTNNIVVFTGHEFNFRHEYRSIPIFPLDDCIPKVRYGLVTASLSFITFCLIITCTGLVLYIRKEKKRSNIDNFLLYNFY